MHENFVHCTGSTRRSVRKQRHLAGAMAQPRRVRQVLSHSSEAVVVPATAHAFQDLRAQRCELGIVPCDTEELRLPTHFMLGRHPIFAGTTTPSCDLSSRESEFFTAVRGACRTLALTTLMLFLGFSMQAELRTGRTAAKGLASLQRAGLVRHIHCPALGWQQAIARRTIRMEKQAASTRSDDVGTTTGIRRCGNCSRDAAVTDVRDELMLHLKTCDGSSA